MDNIFFFIISLILACLASFTLVPIFRHYALSKGIVSEASHRSSHQGVTPRGGGFIFCLVWSIGVGLSFYTSILEKNLLWVVLIPSLLIAGVGFADDLKNLSAKSRLIFQVMVASLTLYLIGGMPVLHLAPQFPISLGIFGIFLGILGLVSSINVFNFMDGTDGIAATEALFVLGLGGYFLQDKGAHSEAFIAWMMTASILGFLVWNWPKARIFMGDVGSYVLGLMIGLLAILGDLRYDLPIVYWILLYGVFCFDASVTLFRRVWLGKKWSESHRDHAYQRLHQAGFSHLAVLLWVICLNISLALITVWVYHRPQDLIVGFLLAFMILSVAYFVVELQKPLQAEPLHAVQISEV